MESEISSPNPLESAGTCVLRFRKNISLMSRHIVLRSSMGFASPGGHLHGYCLVLRVVVCGVLTCNWYGGGRTVLIR